MIVGESEVQGQVRRAYEAALGAGTTGPFTNRLFRAALQTGKRVRSETAISAARVSVSSVAVDAAREVVGDLRGRDVVIIGAGETAELTARALSEQGVTTMFVANRRADRARALAVALRRARRLARRAARAARGRRHRRWRRPRHRTRSSAATSSSS